VTFIIVLLRSGTGIFSIFFISHQILYWIIFLRSVVSIPSLSPYHSTC
jgi:hypothetical protein